MRVNFSYVLNRPTDKETSVLIKYSYDNQRIKGKRSTGLIVSSKDWEPDKKKKAYQRLKTRDSESNAINQSLDSWEHDIKEQFHTFTRESKRFPSKHEFNAIIENVLNGNQGERKRDMLTFIDEYIEDSGHRYNSSTGKNIAKSTICVYRRSAELISEFVRAYNIEPYFEAFDIGCYDKFKRFLYEDKQMSLNTVGKHIKNLKFFANEARERDIDVNKSFSSKRFAVPQEAREAVYLTDEEVKALYALDLCETPRLEKVRDLFVFECETGLRFGDLKNSESWSVNNTREGVILDVVMEKTGQPLSVPLFGMSKDIFIKYEQSLPAISNQKFNKYLKELCKLVPALNVDIVLNKVKMKKYEAVSSHTARRSFATNAVRNNIPTYTIMALTGHKTESSFMKYLKISLRDHAKNYLEHMANSTKVIDLKAKTA